MNPARFCSNRGVRYVLNTARSQRYSTKTMDPRFQAPFDSSYQGFIAAPATPNTTAAPFYPSLHTASASDVQVVADAFHSVSIVNNFTPLQSSQRPPRKMLPTDRPTSQANHPGKSSLSARKKRDAIVPPSKASGGIPNPTNAYLTLSKAIPIPLQEPQHLLVVIDLNGTLLFRPSRSHPTKFTARPNTHQFLKYCIDTFTVAIWSSAKPENVNNMCNAILPPELRKKVVAIWGRDKFGLSPADYSTRVQCYKRLTKLWSDDKVARSHPLWDAGSRWNQTNTVLIDDSLEKGRSEPFNLIEIPEFFGDQKETGEFLPQVHDFLNHLSMHSNVSACLRAQPFKAQFAPLPGNCESC